MSGQNLCSFDTGSYDDCPNSAYNTPCAGCGRLVCPEHGRQHDAGYLCLSCYDHVENILQEEQAARRRQMADAALARVSAQEMDKEGIRRDDATETLKDLLLEMDGLHAQVDALIYAGADQGSDLAGLGVEGAQDLWNAGGLGYEVLTRNKEVYERLKAYRTRMQRREITGPVLLVPVVILSGQGGINADSGTWQSATLAIPANTPRNLHAIQEACAVAYEAASPLGDEVWYSGGCAGVYALSLGAINNGG